MNDRINVKKMTTKAAPIKQNDSIKVSFSYWRNSRNGGQKIHYYTLSYRKLDEPAAIS